MENKSNQNIGLKVKLNSETGDSVKVAIKPAKSQAKLATQEKRFKHV